MNNLKPSHEHSQFTDYEEDAIVSEQPLEGLSRTLPEYTLNWFSRTESYFMTVTGLDFLIGVPEVLLLQTTDDQSLSESKYQVKVPKGKTLYLGIENSTSVQKAMFGSHRNFNMTFLDPSKQEAVSFFRRGAYTNIATCFRQELLVSVTEKNSHVGRIIQENTFSEVTFTVYDKKNEVVFKIVGSQKSFCRNLPQDVHFSILNPIHRTGGVILHKWDEGYKDFLYHISFPSCDINLHHKILLIGTVLLIEYTYFKKTGCFGFT